jgi:hypothetical protein
MREVLPPEIQINVDSLVTPFLEKAAEAGAATATVNSAQEFQRIISEVL